MMHVAGGKKQTASQAVTSWNERLTYKGVSLHRPVSAQGRRSKTKIHQGAECQWLTSGSLSDEKGQVELHCVRGVSKGRLENQNLNCRKIPGRKLQVKFGLQQIVWEYVFLKPCKGISALCDT